MKELLKSIVFDQQSFTWDAAYIKRDIPEYLIHSDEIVVITGIRRCGKSTLLNQLRHESAEKDYFLNFDDERLIGFRVENFQDLLETFIELFGEQHTFYFDEIQNVKGWERFVRRLYDQGAKVYLTGSNASMLSRELGTHLTGRYLSMELYPFSFREYLQLKDIKSGQKEIHSTSGRSLLQKSFNEYLFKGGIPLFLKNNNDEYLKSLYNSILYRDVMVRNKLTHEKEILELVYYLASNVSKLSSYNSLAKTAQVKNASTIRNYIEFLQNTYLLFQISKYDHSLKKQLHNQKKTYFIDNALVNRLGFLVSDNKGRLLENLVFIELMRRSKDIYYHRGKYECDFVLKEGTRIVQAIQVCYTPENDETREREIRGLEDAMTAYDLHKGMVITGSYEEKIVTKQEKEIYFIPAWKWVLD